MVKVYIWQTMLTPHMTALAVSLSKSGYEVFYITQTSLTQDRLELGWELENLKNINVIFAKNSHSVKSIVLQSPTSSIHICQGIRNNGLISVAQKELKKKIIDIG